MIRTLPDAAIPDRVCASVEQAPVTDFVLTRVVTRALPMGGLVLGALFAPTFFYSRFIGAAVGLATGMVADASFFRPKTLREACRQRPPAHHHQSDRCEDGCAWTGCEASAWGAGRRFLPRVGRLADAEGSPFSSL